MKKLSLLILLFVSACGYINGETPTDSAVALDKPNAIVDYAAIRTAVFSPYCIACHSAAGGDRGGINLETYANVNSVLAQISDAVSSGFMPLNSALPANAKAALLKWVAAGAPEFISGNPSLGNDQPNPEPLPNECDDDNENEKCED